MAAVREREGGKKRGTHRQPSEWNLNLGLGPGLYCERGSASELKHIIHFRAEAAAATPQLYVVLCESLSPVKDARTQSPQSLPPRGSIPLWDFRHCFVSI